MKEIKPKYLLLVGIGLILAPLIKDALLFLIISNFPTITTHFRSAFRWLAIGPGAGIDSSCLGASLFVCIMYIAIKFKKR